MSPYSTRTHSPLEVEQIRERHVSTTRSWVNGFHRRFIAAQAVIATTHAAHRYTNHFGMGKARSLPACTASPTYEYLPACRALPRRASPCVASPCLALPRFAALAVRPHDVSRSHRLQSTLRVPILEQQLHTDSAFVGSLKRHGVGNPGREACERIQAFEDVLVVARQPARAARRALLQLSDVQFLRIDTEPNLASRAFADDRNDVGKIEKQSVFDGHSLPLPGSLRWFTLEQISGGDCENGTKSVQGRERNLLRLVERHGIDSRHGDAGAPRELALAHWHFARGKHFAQTEPNSHDSLHGRNSTTLSTYKQDRNSFLLTAYKQAGNIPGTRNGTAGAPLAELPNDPAHRTSCEIPPVEDTARCLAGQQEAAQMRRKHASEYLDASTFEPVGHKIPRSCVVAYPHKLPDRVLLVAFDAEGHEHARALALLNHIPRWQVDALLAGLEARP